jgi:protein disulfide-isomerase
MKIKTLSSIAGLLLLVGAPLLANDTDWLDNFESAKQKAKQEGKAILACFTGSDWCPYCMKLETEILSKNEFKTWAKEKVILLMVDFPRTKPQKAEVAAQNAKLNAEYQISGLPTVLFLSATGDKLGRTGYNSMPVEEWLKAGDFFVDPYNAEAAKDKNAAAQATEQARKADDASRDAAIKARRKELADEGYREWSDKSGRKVFAKYVATAAGVVGLIAENGEKLRIKLSDFSQDDQAHIRSLRESNQN